MRGSTLNSRALVRHRQTGPPIQGNNPVWRRRSESTAGKFTNPQLEEGAAETTVEPGSGRRHSYSRGPKDHKKGMRILQSNSNAQEIQKHGNTPL